MTTIRSHACAAGVRFTLGSDDPPYFGASIGGEYEVCAEHMGMSESDLREITRTGIDAAFCDQALKRQLRERAGLVARGSSSPEAVGTSARRS